MFLHYIIVLVCFGRYKTYDKPMRTNSLEVHWSATVATGIVTPSTFHFPLTSHYWHRISTTQMAWSGTPNPSNEAFMLCSRRAGPLFQKPPRLALLHPMPHWTHPIISASQSSTALSLCSQCPLRLSAHPPSAETSDLLTSSGKKTSL